MQGKCEKNQRLALIAAVLLLVVCSCTGAGPKKGDKPLVVVSITPQAYFVNQIAGDFVQTEVMIPPGASPATYEPSMGQMTLLSEAKLYVKVGHESFPFERVWLDKLLSQAASADVVDSSNGIASIDGDPHIWTSFRQAGIIADNIAEGLQKILPGKAEEMRANLSALKEEIKEADRHCEQLFRDHKGRKFYVFHSAWTYLANDYGLKQVVLEHGHKEPTPHHVQHVISTARAEGAKTIFAQPQMSRESADMVAREIGGRVVVIDPLASNWPEGMRHAAKSIWETFSK